MLTRAIKVSLLVGTALNLIHCGDTLLAGHWPLQPWKIPLTYLVPLAVSYYSSAAERRLRRQDPATNSPGQPGLAPALQAKE